VFPDSEGESKLPTPGYLRPDSADKPATLPDTETRVKGIWSVIHTTACKNRSSWTVRARQQ